MPAGPITTHAALKILSPWGKGTNPPPSSMAASMGNFVCQSLIGRTTVTTAGNERLMIFQPSIRGRLQLGVWGVTGALSSPTFTGTIDNGSPTYRLIGADQPTQIRPLRAGIRLRNTSRADVVQGSIKVANLCVPFDWTSAWDAGTPGDLTSTFMNALVLMMNTSSAVREYTAHECIHQREWVCKPATRASYESYGGTFNNENSTGALASEFGGTASDMAMSCLVVMFSTTVDENSWDVSTALQCASRFPANTLLGDQHKNHLRQEETLANKVHDAAGKSPDGHVPIAGSTHSLDSQGYA